MKTIKKKGILYKAILSLIIVFTISGVVLPTFSHAGVSFANLFGEFFRPFQTLLVGLGDTVMVICQNAGTEKSQPTFSIAKTYEVDAKFASNPVGAILGDLTNASYGVTTINKFWNWNIARGMAYLTEWSDDIEDWPDVIQMPVITVSPEMLFSNNVPLVDVNIFNPSDGSIFDSSDGTSNVKEMISNWYKTFRNIAAVGLLSVLVYLAIRMVISSAAADKAKYKEMLINWLVAFCLLFFMHYIMSFSTTIIEYLTENIGPSYIRVDGITKGELEDEYEHGWPDKNKKSEGVLAYLNSSGELSNSDNAELAFTLTEYIRFNAQTSPPVSDKTDNSITERFAWTVMYLVMVIYTVWFLVIYIKRLVYIILLTMIAPLVALSYPLDKVKDGSAQGFSKWLQEYLFNLLIQPLHLILYTVLIGSAMQIAVEHPIYALIVMGFMLQSEKMLRKLFGFDKSTTASSLVSGAMGGAVVMKGVDWFSNKFGKAAKGASSAAGAATNGIRTADTPAYDNFKSTDKWEVTEMLDSETGSKGIKEGILGGGKSGDTTNNGGLSFNVGDRNTENSNKTDFSGMSFDDKSSNIDASNLTEVINEDGSITYGYDTMGSMPDSGDMGEFTIQDGSSTNIKFNDNINAEGSGTGVDIGTEEPAIIGARTGDSIHYTSERTEVNPGLKELKEKNDEKLKDKNNGRGSIMDGLLEAGDSLGINKKGAFKFAKGAAKGAAGFVGGVTLGTIGVAAGIASDNFANAATFGVAGAAAGNRIGNNVVGNRIDHRVEQYKKVVAAKDAYDKARLSKEEYQKKVNEKIIRQHLASRKNRIRYEKEFGSKKEAQKALKASVTFMNRAGVKNQDTIISCMKEMKKRGLDYDDNLGLAAARYSEQVNSVKQMKDLSEQLRAKKRSEKQINELEQIVRQVKHWNA